VYSTSTGNVAVSGTSGYYFGGPNVPQDGAIRYDNVTRSMAFTVSAGASPLMTLSGTGLAVTVSVTATQSISSDLYLWAKGSGNVGGVYLDPTGTSNGHLSQAAHGDGTVTTYIGNQSITTSSDIRLKDNVKPSERNALNLLSQWEIVDHTWSDPSDQCENNRNSRGVWTGVVAQQVQPITPWLVNKPLEDVNEDGSINPWIMDFGYAVPLLVKAIQEQQAIIESLEARLTAAGL
jgi:hypothetical protein